MDGLDNRKQVFVIAATNRPGKFLIWKKKIKEKW